MLILKKQKNNNVAIFDEKNKKYVPLRGQNLVDAAHNIRDDYFHNLSRQRLIDAVRIVFVDKEEIKTK